MTAKVGSLNVDLTLETARFQKGLSDASRGVGKAQKDMAGLGGTLGTLGKSMAAVGAVFASSAIIGGLKDMAVRGLEFASALGEQAQQLGVTTKELQEYRYAATQAGLSQDEMDTALSKLTRNLGEAAKGSKAQAEAFAKLGINIRDANGNIKSAGAIIPEIAEALKGVHDPAERAAALVDLFGKSGQKLEPLLAGGAAGVNNLRDAAQRLGIVLSDRQIQQADDTADKLAALKTVLEAKIAGAVADNTQQIIDLANALVSLVNAVGDAIRAMKTFNQNRRIFEGDLNAAIYSVPLLGDEKKAAGYRRNAGQAREARANDLLNRNGLTLDSILGKPKAGGSKANFAGTSAGKFDFAPGLIKGGLEAIGGASDKLVETVDAMADRAEAANVRVVRSFREMAQDTLSSMNQLASAIRGGGFLDILSSVIGLGMQLGSAGLFGKKVQTNLGKPVPGYAGGTNFHPGGLAVVGERGPELLHLPRGSAVTPNNRMGATRVVVQASPYFDVRVQENIGRAAPAIASAGGTVGQRRIAYRQSRRLA